MGVERDVKLFRNGRNQAVRIPVEFELPGTDAVMRKVGDDLIISPRKKSGLLEWLDALEQWEGDFPDLDQKDAPPEDVVL